MYFVLLSTRSTVGRFHLQAKVRLLSLVLGEGGCEKCCRSGESHMTSREQPRSSAVVVRWSERMKNRSSTQTIVYPRHSQWTGMFVFLILFLLVHKVLTA